MAKTPSYIMAPVGRMTLHNPRLKPGYEARGGVKSFKVNLRMPTPPRPDMAQMLEDMGIESTYHRALALQKHVRDMLAGSYGVNDVVRHRR